MADASHVGSPAAAAAAGLLLRRRRPWRRPAPVNMAYFGGHVQVTPKIYLVFWGWGQAGAFDHTTPGHADVRPGRRRGADDRLRRRRWAARPGPRSDAVLRDGRTANTSTSQNPANQFGGVWYDDANPIHDNVTGLELAQEAQRAVAHFGVTDLNNSQFVIAQPQKYNEAGFNSGAGYCAWHDYTQPQYYPGVSPASRSRTCRTCSTRARAAARTRSTPALRRPARRLHDRHGPRDRGDRSPTRAPRT